VEILQKKIVVQRERRRDVSVLGKRHQADAVARAFIDEFVEDAFGHVNPAHAFAADHEILGGHTVGKVDRHGDVNAAGLDLRLALGLSRLRQRENKCRQRQPPQRREKCSRARTRDIEHRANKLYRRIEKCRRTPALAFEPCQQRQQQQEQKTPFMSPSHVDVAAGCGVGVAAATSVGAGAGSVSSTRRTAEPWRSFNSTSRGSYWANFTRSQRLRNSPRVSFWSGKRRFVFCNSYKNSSVVRSGARKVNRSSRQNRTVLDTSVR